MSKDYEGGAGVNPAGSWGKSCLGQGTAPEEAVGKEANKGQEEGSSTC